MDKKSMTNKRIEPVKKVRMLHCPHCGAEKDVYYKPGKKITCSACGKEFEI